MAPEIAIAIHVVDDTTGTHYALSPASRRRLGDRLPRVVFIAGERNRMHYGPVQSILTDNAMNLITDANGEYHTYDVTFVDPVTEQEV